MRPLSAVELLNIWEQGYAAPSLQQALLLLAVACPELSSETLARLSIGRRDSLLLKLRTWTFGRQLASLVNCPNCGERLEFTIDSAALLLTPDEERPETFSVSLDGYEVTFRLPNSLDLAAIAHNVDLETGQQALLQRCLISVRPVGETQPAEQPALASSLAQLPQPVMARVLQQMEAVDSQADMQLALTCPACSHHWNALFDIITFFWREIDDWARRTLREVHLLASAYGWTEADILSLSAWRRRAYLEMVGG